MNALGVLKGDGTNYNPKGILTRAEAAVMLAKLIGEGDIKATSTYKDMAGYEWAQNFAAVCEAKGFILGDGKGGFHVLPELLGTLPLLSAIVVAEAVAADFLTGSFCHHADQRRRSFGNLYQPRR